MMKTKHLVMSIEWLERKINSFKSYSWKNKYCKDCFEMTHWEVIYAIEEYKEKWYTVIPSESCPNVNKDWTCWC